MTWALEMKAVSVVEPSRLARAYGHGHVRFSELCQSTRSHPLDCGEEIASIDLEIQTVGRARLLD